MAGRSELLKSLVAFAIVFFMLAAFPASPDEPEGEMARTSADGSRVYVIGSVDFSGYMSTLSPFRYTSQQERMVIWPCYSTLLTYDRDGKLIGDVARSWSPSSDGLTWHFKMEHGIYFTDPTSPLTVIHQLTWVDIQYSYFQAQNFSNNLQSNLMADGQGAIARIWGDATTDWVNITLRMPFAPFLNALTILPIIPKYYWEPHETPAGDATSWTGALPIGSGPFYYGLPALPTTGEVILKRNPIWFQESNRGWQVHVDTLKYRNEVSHTAAWNDLRLGNLDLLLDVNSSTYLNGIPAEPSLFGWAQSSGYVYEYNLCQMTDAMRNYPGSPYNTGTNSQILLDPVVKRAMAMAVDKQGFVDQTLLGLGSPADSLVPEDNPWHYDPEGQVAFDLVGANALLQANGYIDVDADGIRECTATSPAVLNGLSSLMAELNFRFVTLDQETTWLTGGALIRDWASQIGVKLNLIYAPMWMMNSNWSKANYDTWLWNWEFYPNSDPSTDILRVFTTMAIGSWQDLYWSNATFDLLYNMSLVEMDLLARRTLVNQLQQMAYDNMGCQPVAYKKSLYAANLLRWAKSSYEGCGTKWTLAPQFAKPWLYMQLSPVDNSVPVVSLGTSTYQVLARIPNTFTGTASDSSPLEYQWLWGDGTATGWIASPSAVHSYSRGGWYTAYFAARETGTGDAFSTWKKVTVVVTDPLNTPPHDLTLTVLTASPEALRPVAFAGDAVDDDGDILSFSWNFGDSATGWGPSPQHTYMSQGTYSVTMYVTDNQPGLDPPASLTYILYVKPANTPPSLSVPPYPVVVRGVPSMFTVEASDADTDPLRFTWVWGDGSVSVTSSPTAIHTYTQKKTYTLTVFADDMTGIAGHNVSAWNTVTVLPLIAQPTIVDFSATPTAVLLGDPITFNGSAMCANGGALRFTFEFGDSTYYVADTGNLAGLEVASFSVDHTYSTAGSKTAWLHVENLVGLNTTSPPITVAVVTRPPIIAPLDPVTALAGRSVVFTASVFDPDSPVLRYTWNFGDGTPLVVGNPAVHVYSKPGKYTFTVYVDDLSGLPSHNVSTSATATIGFGLQLFAGWNMISIPLIANYNASTLGLSSGDMMVRWNSSRQVYDKTYVAGLPPINDFPLEMNTGYWIYSAMNRILAIFGSIPTTTQSRYISVPAGGGWALIGLSIWNHVGLKAHDLVSMFDPPTLRTVVRYSQPYGVYQTYIVGVPVNDFQLVNGEGYWVFLSGSSNFRYNP